MCVRGKFTVGHRMNALWFPRIRSSKKSTKGEKLERLSGGEGAGGSKAFPERRCLISDLNYEKLQDYFGGEGKEISSGRHEPRKCPINVHMRE